MDGVEAAYRSGDWEFGSVLGNFSQSIDDVAAWSAAYAPRKTTEAEIVSSLAALEEPGLSEELGGRSMVFAEEGVEAIFNELLGIGSIHAD